MEKILVNVKAPVLGMSFDVFLPQDVPVVDLIATLSEGIIDLEGDKFQRNGMEQLMLSEPPTLLAPNKTPLDYGIREGDCLILL